MFKIQFPFISKPKRNIYDDVKDVMQQEAKKKYVVKITRTNAS